MTARYAFYFIPPEDSDLYRLGSSLLGRCLVTGRQRRRPALDGFSADELAGLTEVPAHYGLHATVVAPFEAAVDEASLFGAAERLASTERGLNLPPLELKFLDGGFLALAASEHCPALHSLEARWVLDTACLRRPLGADDIARRGELPPRQSQNLRRWGYHLVMEDFRFHITLTGPVKREDQPRVRKAIAEYLRPVLGQPSPLDALALVYQGSRPEPFTRLKYLFLGE